MKFLKFGIERFDGRIDFELWQIQVKDIQSGLRKSLRGTGLANCSKDTNIVSLVTEKGGNVL